MVLDSVEDNAQTEMEATPARTGPLAGKTVVVTGANSGIGAFLQPPLPAVAEPALALCLPCWFPGLTSPAPPGFETAAELASRGASVVLACRRMQAAEDAASAIRCAPVDSDIALRESHSPVGPAAY